MSTDLLEPETKNRSKTQRAPRFNVVFHRPATSSVRLCCARILQDVFNLTKEAAMERVTEASKHGRSIVFSHFHDVAETKELQANNAVAEHAKHNKRMHGVFFKMEKSAL